MRDRDFGSGYSSLSYLTRLPVDILKIDRALTATVGDGVAGSAVMQAAIALGRHLGIQTVAEGVEEEGQLRRLRLMGCRLAQGFLFSRPMVPEAALKFALRSPAEPARADSRRPAAGDRRSGRFPVRSVG